MWFVRVAMVCLLVSTAVAQTSPVASAREWRQSRGRAILDEFTELLRIPNVSGDLENLRRNAEFIEQMFARRGVTMRLFEIEGYAPVVYGELYAPDATQTIAFYTHYDGSPVEADEWYTSDPFRPTLSSGALERGGRPIPLPNPGWPTDPEWRLYARSASDAKSAIVALATALDALEARGVPIQSNLKFFFDGQHERGSPELPQYLEEHRELLNADLWLLLDGTIHTNGQNQVIFGKPGAEGLDLTVYGPRVPLDSTVYGGWANDPAMMLARLLASMTGDDGRVAVDGFYDDVEPLEESAREAIAEAPDDSAERARELWVARDPSKVPSLSEVLHSPALTVSRISAGNERLEADRLIPSTASASVDIRLVKGMDHLAVSEKVIEHIRDQGFTVVESEPNDALRRAVPRLVRITRRPGHNAVRTSMDLPIARRTVAALEAARGPVVKLPAADSPLPLDVIHESLGSPVLVIPIADPDDRRHGPNENIRLQSLWDGIETVAALLAMEPEAYEGE